MIQLDCRHLKSTHTLGPMAFKRTIFQTDWVISLPRRAMITLPVMLGVPLTFTKLYLLQPNTLKLKTQIAVLLQISRKSLQQAAAHSLRKEYQWPWTSNYKRTSKLVRPIVVMDKSRALVKTFQCPKSQETTTYRPSKTELIRNS